MGTKKKERKHAGLECNITSSFFTCSNDFEELSPAITAPYPHKEPCSEQEDQPLLP